MLISFFAGAVSQIERGLVYANRRHEVIVQNIANLETPGYKAKDLVFADALNASSTAGGLPVPLSPDDRGGRLPRLVQSNDGAVNADGNDVNLDRQMARLSENTLFQHALVQILSGQFNALKQAISGRV
jgi:flagellar basal-body rod protein FlgB